MVKDASRQLHWAMVIVVFAIIVGGCKTDAEYAGNGPLKLSTPISNYLDKFLNDRGGATFAVSADGQCATYRHCRSGGTCREGDERYFAIQDCENYCKKSCKLLAVYRSIVWNGPVSGLPKAMQRPQDISTAGTDPDVWLAKGCAKGATALFAAKAGPAFRECPECPEMIILPAGNYRVGSYARNTEMPIHDVTLAKPFAVGKFEVTFEEWDACVDDGGCNGQRPSDAGWGRGRQPVVNIGWYGAKAYVAWISKKTGGTYRLLSESEWEYAARAGACSTYTWGNEIGTGNAVCRTCGTQWDGKRPAPVGQFRSNAFGLHDTAGNVNEWVEDCNNSYNDRPRDGTPVTTGKYCSLRQLRGGSWGQDASELRPESREMGSPYYESPFAGFRVAKTLN